RVPLQKDERAQGKSRCQQNPKDEIRSHIPKLDYRKKPGRARPFPVCFLEPKGITGPARRERL
ncbi:MAG: hypothetical protein ACREE6_18515, partial [Limisphaerales bacterium]